MSFDYDPTTDAGKVRLLIADTDSANPIFQDAEIDAFLSMNGSSVKRAAAAALRTIAASETLVQKRIKILEIQTDGPSESAELRALANALIEEAENDEAAEGGTFDVAEFAVSDFQQRERIYNEALKNG